MIIPLDAQQKCVCVCACVSECVCALCLWDGKLYTLFFCCSHCIQVVTTKQHDIVFTDLLAFVSSSNKQLESLHQSSLSKEEFRPPRLEIPTAVLIAGVNMPDHDVLFEQLRVMIRNDISPHVVLLKSSNCTTGTLGVYLGV